MDSGSEVKKTSAAKAASIPKALYGTAEAMPLTKLCFPNTTASGRNG